jgi:hypothetical protein
MEGLERRYSRSGGERGVGGGWREEARGCEEEIPGGGVGEVAILYRGVKSRDAMEEVVWRHAVYGGAGEEMPGVGCGKRGGGGGGGGGPHDAASRGHTIRRSSGQPRSGN